MSIPNPSTNSGCLGLLFQFYQYIGNLLFGASEEDKGYVAGFSIDQLYNPANTSQSLLHILQCNYQEAQEKAGDGNTAYVPLGWFMIFGKPEDGSAIDRKDVQLVPRSIMQLVLTIDENVVRSPEENCSLGGAVALPDENDSAMGSPGLSFHLKKVNEYLGASSCQTDPGMTLSYMHHAIFPNQALNTYYHNYVEEDSIAEGREMTLGDLEYFKKETDLVFFSTTQLFMMKRILDFQQAHEQNLKVIFSGYDLFLGRLANKLNMWEAEQMAAGASMDPIHCFTLKAEVVNIPDLIEDGETTPLQEPVSPYGDFEIDNPDGEVAQEPTTGTTDKAPLCDALEAAGIPLAWLGNPCPPVWELMESILSTVNTFDSGIDPNAIACTFLETSYGDGPMRKDVMDAGEIETT